MKYYLATYGCQMNQSDSERIAAYLQQKGYQPVSDYQEADFVLVNMCAVRQSAVDRIFGLIHNINKIKQKGQPQTFLTGCILPPDQKKFQEKFDYVVKKENLFSTLDQLTQTSSPKSNLWSITPKYQSPFRAYVPTMSGCDEYCTYCVVPHARGKVKFRPAPDIMKQVKNLIKRDYKFIWLVGQTVNNYEGKLNSHSINFAQLIKHINQLEGDFWLGFTSPHPSYFTDELVKTIAQCKKVIPYLNLPLQSGDNQILQKMNRSYTVKEYLRLVTKLRDSFQQYREGLERYLALSIDIILGFPGETKKQFQNTVKIFQKVKYDMAYIAKYSPRPQTAASKLEDNVSMQEKKRREKKLTQILKKTAYQHNKRYLNKKIPVLVERCDKQEEVMFGKSRSHKTVKIKPVQKKYLGKILPVEITEIKSLGLKGQISL